MAADTERFRLRRFVERLVQLGECEVHEQPIDMVDIGAVLDGNPRATWFKAVGPEKAELIGNVMGSRKRLALALGTDEAGLLPEITKRLADPHKPVKVAAKDAPVQQVVLQGEQADLCALPVHLQHGDDGAPYISAGLDVMQFRGTGHSNIGCRRIMLRGPRTAGIDMIAPSDARAIYLEAAAKGEKTPVAYVVGSTPCDFMAAVCMNPPMDELEVLGALRGAPVPIVKCVTSDIYVPADAEYVL
jgi:UbiD family decarboxylase